MMMDWSQLQRDVALSLATTVLALLAAAVVVVLNVHLRGPSLPAPSPGLRRKLASKADDAGSADAPGRRDSVNSADESDGTRPTSGSLSRRGGAPAVPKKAPKHFVDLIEMSTKRVMENIGETAWVPVSKDAACDISVILEKTKLPDRYKATGRFKASADTVLRCIYDMKTREKWDKGMVGTANRLVVDYDQSYSITYYATGSVMGVPGRDFLDLRRLMKLEGNQGYLVVAHSVEHPDQPQVSGLVRAFNHPNGQLIRRLDDGICELTYFVQVDLKGWIPKQVLRLALSGSLSRIFGDLKTYCESIPYSNGFRISDALSTGSQEQRKESQDQRKDSQEQRKVSTSFQWASKVLNSVQELTE